MSERISLFGDIKQKIKQALEYAGWYPERIVDTTIIEEYYKSFGFDLSEKSKEFFCKYYGIKSQWYIKVLNLEWGADFEFRLFPYPKTYATDFVNFMFDDNENILKSEEYESVLNYTNDEKNLVMVGEIGYHYPARVWIGETGRIYATHDYEEDVLEFDSVEDLIEYEVKGCKLDSIAMK